MNTRDAAIVAKVLITYYVLTQARFLVEFVAFSTFVAAQVARLDANITKFNLAIATHEAPFDLLILMTLSRGHGELHDGKHD